MEPQKAFSGGIWKTRELPHIYYSFPTIPNQPTSQPLAPELRDPGAVESSEPLAFTALALEATRTGKLTYPRRKGSWVPMIFRAFPVWCNMLVLWRLLL